MSPKMRQLIDKQPQVKVAELSGNIALNDAWYGALALLFAGVFYFFAYYFWGNLGGALTGG